MSLQLIIILGVIQLLETGNILGAKQLFKKILLVHQSHITVRALSTERLSLLGAFVNHHTIRLMHQTRNSFTQKIPSITFYDWQKYFNQTYISIHIFLGFQFSENSYNNEVRQKIFGCVRKLRSLEAPFFIMFVHSFPCIPSSGRSSLSAVNSLSYFIFLSLLAIGNITTNLKP